MCLPYLLVVPTEVRILEISDNITNLVISWLEPIEANGNLTYTITIVCENLLSGVVFTNESQTMLSSREVTTTRLPFSLCSVTVTAQTGAGVGPASGANFQTPEEGETVL